MKTTVIPQIRVEPELHARLESVLKHGETLTGFMEVAVRNDHMDDCFAKKSVSLPPCIPSIRRISNQLAGHAPGLPPSRKGMT